MPIDRNPGEGKDEFLARCISTEVAAGKDNDQAAAICYTQLKKINMAEEAPAIPQEEIDYCLLVLQGQNPTYVGPGALKICIDRLTAKKENQKKYGLSAEVFEQYDFKYDWDKCILDRKSDGYSEKVAEKICGAIRAGSINQ
jgi:hypothetical protein